MFLLMIFNITAFCSAYLVDDLSLRLALWPSRCSVFQSVSNSCKSTDILQSLDIMLSCVSYKVRLDTCVIQIFISNFFKSHHNDGFVHLLLIVLLLFCFYMLKLGY